MKLWLDIESVGLVGPPVLLQYAEDGGPVKMHHVWKCPAGETIQLLEWIAAQSVHGWNTVFDWYMVQKLHSMLSCLKDQSALPSVEEML